MIETIIPAFVELGEFAGASAGGKVVFATDDFFATCENMILDSEPAFDPERYTECGKLMDGWETRRRRRAGHDWCVLKLATKCVIRGLLVDTAFFTGNYAPKYSIQAARLTAEEEAQIPERVARIGTACSDCDLLQMEELRSERWEEIVPATALRPGYQDTRLNFQKVLSDEAWTHIRVNMYPDGGIARLRVFGLARPERPAAGLPVDLASLLNGATCLAYSNAHYGHPRNIIKPSKGANMGDGWETARRLDRPEVIQANEDGTLKIPGEEWAIFQLGYCGFIKELCVDTSHFKGNFPDSIKVEGAYVASGDRVEPGQMSWQTILRPSKLSAHREHWYRCEAGAVSHVRVTLAPDGGISRLRAFGLVAPDTL